MAEVVTRPSAAPRWTRCALAPTLTAKVGERPAGDPAREGTCAAWVAECVIAGRYGKCADMIGTAHENGWTVDEEMASHCQDYVDMIAKRGGQYEAEKFVTLSTGPLIAGTMDVGAYDPDTATLYIDDLKYGYRVVKPDSPQLAIYACATLWELQRVQIPVRSIVTGIYQPRAFVSGGPHRTKTWTPDELDAAGRWIIDRARDCHAPSPTATPGPHCRNCDGATACHALQSTTEQIVAIVQDTDHGETDAATLARQVEFHRWAGDVVKAASEAAEAEAIARHQSGDTLPGWGLSERWGQTKVTATRATIKALTGKDLPVREKPPLVGDLKNAGLSDAQVKLFTDRPMTGYKLEPLDDADLASRFPTIK